jgi:predicted oxidoreductase
LYGLAINDKSQVLDKSGQPIPGLYTAGNDQNSLWRGSYPSGGSWLSSAKTLG